MSVELRVATEGDCTCGTPKPVGSPPSNCRHVIVTKWGRITTPRPIFWSNNPEVEPLMLASREWVDGMAQTGETRELCSALAFAYRDNERLFVTAAHNGMSWTWECFEAHWADEADDKPTVPLYIGRWPD